MKRRVTNEKVLRAISMGIAAMLAVTSTPITAFAEGNEQQTAPADPAQAPADPAQAPANNSGEGQQSQAKEEATVENIGKIQEEITHQDETGENPGVSQSIDAAAVKAGVAGLNDQDVTNLEGAAADVDDKKDESDETGDTSGNAVKETMDHLEDLKDGIATNNAAVAAADQTAKAISEKVVVAVQVPVTDESGNQIYDNDGNPQMQWVYVNAFGDDVTKAEIDLGATENNVRTANTSSDENTARKAATAAQNNLNNAAKDISDADVVVKAAENGVEQAWTDLQNARKDLVNATVKLEALEGSLAGAQTKSQAAYDKVKALQDRVNQLEADVAELEQVYAVYTSYNDAVANGSFNDKWIQAGNLTKALVMYYVSREEGYAGGFQVSGGIPGYENLAKDLFGFTRTVNDTQYNFPDVYVDKEGNLISNNSSDDVTKYKYHFWNETGWVISPEINGKQLPNNVVVVRYQSKIRALDENGNPKSDENGNPVYKYETDENGNVQVDENGNPKYKTQEVERYFNCKRDAEGVFFFERTIDVVGEEGDQRLVYSSDDLQRGGEGVYDTSVVQKYIEYHNSRNELNAAKIAVDQAEKETRELKEAIAKLKVSEPNSEELDALSMRLEMANEMFDAAKKRRDELQKRYNELKKAVDSIDLSRFNRSTPSDDDDDDYTAGASDDGYTDGYISSGFSAGGSVSLIPITFETTGGANASGVLGARADDSHGRSGGNGGADNEKTGVLGANKTKQSANGTAATAKNSNKQGDKSETDDGDKELVKIDNNLVPLADTPFKEDGAMNPAWLLAAAAAAIAAGATAEHERRKRKKAVAVKDSEK